jgi:DNA-binding transcriptional LysR family regulator
VDVHLRDLRYFVAVAEEGTVTRAAERLFVSQPAVSKQVRRLERDLGFDLFRRTPDGVRLTDQGARLLPEARRLLADWHSALAATRAEGGTITVGMQTALGRGLGRELSQRLAGTGWRLALRLVPWTDPSAGLADGTSDAALLWRPLTLDGVESRTLHTEPRLVALPEGHRLAARTGVRREELDAEPFVALPAEAGALRRWWLAGDATVALEADSPDETIEAVAAGAGVALVAEGNARLYARPGVTFVLVEDVAPAELALVWRQGEPGPALSALLAALG